MEKLLLLGVGSVARAVQRMLPEHVARGTTRQPADARFVDIEPIAARDERAIRAAAEGARVVVSVPPDGHSDREFAALVSGASSIVYLSSTAVYPPAASIVTELSSVAPDGERGRLRVNAEAEWLAAGASVVRLPAFYGPESGLHLSLARGTFRMPGRGANIVSRVHVDDAARFVLAALFAVKGSILLAGDDQPAPVAEVVEFVSVLFELPRPLTGAGDNVPVSLRGSRSVDNRVTKTRFGIELAYPSYREGYRAIRHARSRTP